MSKIVIVLLFICPFANAAEGTSNIVCFDARDGSTFEYAGELLSMTPRAGPNSCFGAFTSQGYMELCRGDEAFLKCKIAPPKQKIDTTVKK